MSGRINKRICVARQVASHTYSRGRSGLASGYSVCRKRQTGKVDAGEADAGRSRHSGLRTRAPRPLGPRELPALFKELPAGAASEQDVSHASLDDG
jgi:hypothetical protein